MTYLVGDILFESAGTTDSGAVRSTVSNPLTARVFFGATLIAKLSEPGATLAVKLFLNGEQIGITSSSHPGLSVSGSVSVDMKPGKQYEFIARQENQHATAESTSLRGVIVIVD